MAYKRTPEEILHLYARRHVQRGPLIQEMERVRDAYNGDIALPLPELSKSESPSVPNLVAQGLDQTSTRIASILPDLYYHPDRSGFKKWEERARERRRVNLGWWDQNNLALKLRRRARWLLGYANSPVLIKPSLALFGPEWHIRNPLSTFPADTDNPDSITPSDCIFSYTRTVDWLTRNYGSQYSTLRRSSESSPDDRVTIIEYVDDEQITCLLISSRQSYTDPYIIDATRPYSTTPSIRRSSYAREKVIGTENFAVLKSLPNRAMICPAVVPGRITLDKEQGAYNGIVGMYQTMAMLFALETRAVIQGVWPDTWAIARANENVEIITEADGRRGIIGKIQGGEIKALTENPGYMTNPTLDRLEAYQRSSANIPAEFGGESPSNIRTGRRGADVLSSTIDFVIQEAQVLFEKSLEQENIRAIEIDKAYFDTPKSYYVNWRGARGPVDYTPSSLFTSSHHSVRYSLPGTDLANLTVITGQKQGLGNMSRRTAMELDPQIEDVELELDRIQAESLERAMQASIEQMAVQGMIPPSDVARIAQLVRENRMELAEAIMTVQAEAQERQATQSPPGSAPTQPGIAQPGTGAESAAIPAPTPDIQSLGAALSALYPATAAIRQG